MVRAVAIDLNSKGSRFELPWPGGAGEAGNRLEVESPLIGRYNVSNLLGAIATVWALGAAMSPPCFHAWAASRGSRDAWSVSTRGSLSTCLWITPTPTMP